MIAVVRCGAGYVVAIERLAATLVALSTHAAA